MAFLKCPMCGLQVRPREMSVAPRHCPRCIAHRARVVALVGDEADASQPQRAPSRRFTRTLEDAGRRGIRVADPPRGRSGAARAVQAQSRFHGRLRTGTRTAWVALYGDLDIAAAAAAQRLLDRADEAGTRRVVVDLGGLEFIDSTGLAMLLTAHRRLGERLTVMPGPAAVHRTFERTGTERLLPFAGGQARAVRASRSPEPDARRVA